MRNLFRIINDKRALISLAVFSFLISFDPDWSSKGLILLTIVSTTRIDLQKKYLQNRYVFVLLVTLIYIAINTTLYKNYSALSSYTVPALCILFFLIFSQTKTSINLKRITFFFTFGIFVVGGLNLIVFFTDPTININFINAWNATTIFDIHKTYYASLLNISFLLLLYFYVENRITSKIVLILSPFFLVLLVFTGSVVNACILILLILLYLSYKYLPTLYGYIFFFFLGAQLLVLLALSNPLGNQFLDILDGDLSRVRNFQVNSLVVNQAPFFGHGIGNELEIVQSYRNNNSWEYINKYNAHNQFFQYVLGGGFIYLLLCIFPFIYINIKNRVFNRNLFANGLTLIFCYIFMIESFQERHHGQIIFSFFITLIAYKINLEKHK